MTSRVCVCVSGWISQPYIVLCPVSKHKLAEMPQQDRFVWMTPLDSCKNNGWDGETELSSHAPARPQTARLKHVQHIETPRSAKHEANNRLYKIWPLRQKIAVAIWPSAAERYILRYFKRNLRHLLTWLYIEESTLKHRVPAQPLHPACSNCHPAKPRVLTTQRAKKKQYDLACKCHPDLQRLGNTRELARLLLEVDINFIRITLDLVRLLFLNRLTAQTILQGSGGTPSMNITLLSSPQTALISMLFDHTGNTPPKS